LYLTGHGRKAEWDGFAESKPISSIRGAISSLRVGNQQQQQLGFLIESVTDGEDSVNDIVNEMIIL